MVASDQEDLAGEVANDGRGTEDTQIRVARMRGGMAHCLQETDQPQGKQYCTGETASAPMTTVEAERQRIQELLAGYSLDDIYNADETGLSYA